MRIILVISSMIWFKHRTQYTFEANVFSFGIIELIHLTTSSNNIFFLLLSKNEA